MEPSEKRRQELARAYGLSALGFTFGAAVIVFTAIGWLLDKWLHTIPLFTIIAALTGAVLGFLNVYFRIKRDEIARRKQKSE
jgi:F0F1-type ATP synthase assembly protein I